jgi:hypothetical protein
MGEVQPPKKRRNVKMALPRKQLQEKLENVTPETVKEVMQWILDGHTASLEAVQEERDSYKAKAETLDAVTKERDTYKEQAEKSGDAAKVQADFDAYKQKVEGEKTLNAKRTALLTAAEQAGVSREQFRAAIVKAWDMDTLDIDENGAAKDPDGLKAAIQKDYADFIGKPGTEPVPPANPPAGNGKTYSKADIEKMSVDEINKLWESGKGIPGITK